MVNAHANIRLPYTFLGLTLLLLLATGLASWLGDKAAVHLALNACHQPWLDVFMRYYTQMGEWVPYVVVVVLLFYKAGWSLFLLTDLLLSGLLAQQLKYVFSTLRPVRYFQDFHPDVTLPLVDGQRLSEFYSMPSGHTVSLFVLFLTLSLVVANGSCGVESSAPQRRCSGRVSPLMQLLFFCLAALGAYSRIYLHMHFAEDIFGGALLAVCFTFLLLIFVPKLQKKAFWDWNFKKMHLK